MDAVKEWLLEGDPSVAFLASTELYGEKGTLYRTRVGKEGWCAQYLKARNQDGSWGRKFYQPKWISTHYTLLELRNLRYNSKDVSVRKEIERASREERGFKNGVKVQKTALGDDTCVAGMYLNYASYFGADAECLKPVVDYIFQGELSDGGFNCMWDRSGAVHSSLHTTLSVLEGFHSYVQAGYAYQVGRIKRSMRACVEFMLEHRLFRSSRTGDIIDEKFLRMTYPFRWKFTVLRALSCLADIGMKHDTRMDDALLYIESKRQKDGLWKLQSKFPGEEFFAMEPVGKPSRMITFLCLKALKRFG